MRGPGQGLEQRGLLLQLGREGMQWYVASADQHFVGMCNHIPLANQPMYSAATFGSPANIARTRQLEVFK